MKKRSLILAATSALLISLTATAQSALETAATALKSGDLAAAEAALTPLIAGEKPDPAALRTLSEVRLGQQRAKEAVALAERAVQLVPDQSANQAQLGIALSVRMSELGFMQQAMTAGKMRKAFEKAVELDPKNLNALIGLARYFANAPEIAGGSLEKAAAFAERVKALDAFMGEMELGRIAEKGEKFSEALTHYQTAAQLKPDAVGPQHNGGRMLAKLGRKDEARACFTKALQLKPGFAPSVKALADLDAPTEKP